MGLFPQQFIDDLRLQANIVRVIQEYVPLKRAGTKYKGLCPFHSEKTPSLHRRSGQGVLLLFRLPGGRRCRSSSSSSTRKSVSRTPCGCWRKSSASRIPETTDATPEDARRDAALREALLKVHEVAAAFFREQLAAAAGARARRQLADRGVSADTIAPLGSGCAPAAPTGLKSRLLEQGFSHGVLLQSGLVQQRDNGDVVDRFRNRLMVPICRDTGSVIAFGGRAMDDEQVPKYLNSPETPIYSKGRTLYGLNLTKASVRQLGLRGPRRGLFRFRAGISDPGGAGGRVLRHGADPAAGAAAAPVHDQGGAQLRPGRRRTGRRGTSRASCWSPRGSTSTSRCWTRAKIPIRSSGGTVRTRYREKTAQFAAVSRVSARPGGGGRRLRPGRQPAAVPGEDARGRGPYPRSGGAGSVWRPDRPQSADYRRGRAGGNPEGGGAAGARR